MTIRHAACSLGGGVVAAVILACSPVAGQNAFAPGVAFGANAFPLIRENEGVWAGQIDLFTELSKDLVLDDTNAFRRYNDIDRTLGFNQVGWTRTGLFDANWAGFEPQYRLWGSAGVITDIVTEFFQNDFGHGLRRLTYVPRDTAEAPFHHVMGGIGGELGVSRPLGFSAPFWCCDVEVVPIAAGGVSPSSVFTEAYATSGVNVIVRSNPSDNYPQLHLLELGGLARAGRVWDRKWKWMSYDRMYLGLAQSYWMYQVWTLLPPVAEFFGQTWTPRVRVTYTCSRGPFVEGTVDQELPEWAGLCGGHPAEPGDWLIENLISIRLEFKQKLAIETWNDFGAKDLGPTFGLRVEWR